MNKIKVGDLIVFKHALYPAVKFNIGDQFRVTAIYGKTRIKIQSVDKTIDSYGYYTTDQFELVDAILTPEEVLQYFKEGRQHELEYTYPNGIVLGYMSEYSGIKCILEGTWRVKPIPKTIDYYGTEIPKPVTKEEAEAEGLKVVYRPLLGRLEYLHLDVPHELRSDGQLYFRTKEDAITVRKLMLKPFE